MIPLRISTVPYVNIAPFTAALRESVACEIAQARPSDLTALRARSGPDLCMLSASEILRLGLEPLAGACLGACGPVESVLLVSRGAPRTWSSVALDAASATSCRLAALIIEERLGVRPELRTSASPVRDLMCGRAGAALVIGDAALEIPPFPLQLDLAEEWHRWTGLPFVFAAWVEGRAKRIPRLVLEGALRRAREASPRHVAACAEAHAARSGVARARIESYLRDRIAYRFGPAERAGLDLFARLVAARGPGYGEPRAAGSSREKLVST